MDASCRPSNCNFRHHCRRFVLAAIIAFLAGLVSGCGSPKPKDSEWPKLVATINVSDVQHFGKRPVWLSGDASWLATACADEGPQCVHLYDASTRNLIVTLNDTFSYETSFAVSPDEAWLAGNFGDEGVVHIHSLAQKERPELKAELSDAGDWVGCVAFVFKKDLGMWLATGSNDGNLRLYNLVTSEWQLMATLPLLSPTSGAMVDLAFSPDGNSLAVASEHFGILLVNVTSPTTPQLAKNLTGCYNVDAVAFSPDGSWLATGCEDGELTVYSMPDATPTISMNEMGYPLWSVAFSGDGHWLAAAGTGPNNSVFVYPTGGFEHRSYWDVVRVNGTEATSNMALAWSANGESLIFSSWDEIYVYDFEGAPDPWPSFGTGASSQLLLS